MKKKMEVFPDMKKALAWILVCALCCALLAGCGAKEAPAEPAPAQPAPTAAEAESPAAAEPAPTDEPESPYAWWEGDWYGWWCVYSADGIYEDMEDVAWDAYARIELSGPEAGYIEIWDTETGDGDYVATCGVSFGQGVTEHGRMMSESGAFYGTGAWLYDPPMPSAVLGHADWIVDPGASTISQFGDMIEIEGRYEDPEDEDNHIDYYIFLRPWGTEWEDVRNGDTEPCIYDDMMPLYYDEWYIPLLDMGAAMPATFDEGEALVENAPEKTPEPAQEPEPTEEPEPPQAAEPAATAAPAPKPAAAGASGAELSFTIDEFMTEEEVTFTFTMPEAGWVADVPNRTLYIYNEPSPDVTHSGSPRIQFELRDTKDKIDTYKDKYENIKAADPRSIGGIEMEGRSYTYAGMEWTEYYGQLPGGLWVLVKASGVELAPGTEGGAILESVRME